MSLGRARYGSRLLVSLALMLTLGLMLTADLRAQEPSAGTWEQLTGVPGAVDELFAPASGPLYAQSGLNLYRSDDGGNAWSTVNLPPAGTSTSRQIAINSNNHQRIYVTGAEGLYKTTDDAASWTVTWPTDPDFPTVLAIAPSPADQDLVYLLVRSKTQHLIRLLRSQDGGQSWTTVEQDGHEGLVCPWVAYLLQAHPTDPDRLFRALDCYHALPSSTLQESRDRGASWTVLVDAGGTRPETVQDPRGQPATAPTPAPTPTPTGRVTLLSPTDRAVGGATPLVGGQGVAPGRFYLVVEKAPQGGGMSLLQTSDDGLTWIERLSYAGGGGMTPADDPRPNVTMAGLTMDPANPDHLIAAFNEKVKGQPATDTIRTSTDGGQTWTVLGSGNPGRVIDLALGIDGRNLYAATATGLWRLALGQ